MQCRVQKQLCRNSFLVSRFRVLPRQRAQLQVVAWPVRRSIDTFYITTWPDVFSAHPSAVDATYNQAVIEGTAYGVSPFQNLVSASISLSHDSPRCTQITRNQDGMIECSVSRDRFGGWSITKP